MARMVGTSSTMRSERIARIALPGRERILEGDDRQAARVGDALEVLDRHGRRLAKRERRRREHQQRRSAAGLRHAGDARRFQAAVGPDAVDDRQPAADLVPGDVEDAALLLEGAGRDLGRMGVDGDRREAGRRRDVAQVLAEALLVDRKVVGERQQDRRNDALRDIIGVTGTRPSPTRL